MAIDLRVSQLPEPLLEFGGAGDFTNPKFGLRDAGPFDLRFGAAHPAQIRLGIIGPQPIIGLAQHWFERISTGVASGKEDTKRYPDYPGFEEIFKTKLLFDQRWMVVLDTNDSLKDALKEKNATLRFEQVLNIYSDALERLSKLEIAKPDVIICAISEEVKEKCFSINMSLSWQEKKAIRFLEKQRRASQPGLFEEMEETTEDLLFRDFRRALKARAMRLQIPIQLVTNNLLIEKEKGIDPAARAWNISVALYYKAGGIPWRLKASGPETCFVGITFFHLKTTKRHLVRSSIAQAFSTEGEGFALRGESIPWDEKQGRNVHLSEAQAYRLGTNILDEYRNRTGGTPLRVVLHKTSKFDEAEVSGFKQAFHNIPVLELINMLETEFRLVHFGMFPPRRGTSCTVNNAKAYLFTTGFMPEIGTYPGMHIPRPIQIEFNGTEDFKTVASDILGLTKMNWNTASMAGGQPVTLMFARKIGGVMAEHGENPGLLTSFRYYI